MPLASGRVAAMAGTRPSLAYFCAAGAIIACNGWLDVLLYASTRRTILFSDAPPSQDTGLDTFSYIRTPLNRRFGNFIFVAGGVGATENQGPDDQVAEASTSSSHRRHHRQRGGGGDGNKVKKKENFCNPLGRLARLRGEAGQSEVSLRDVEENRSADGGVSPVVGGAGRSRNGLAIQLETVTTVLVEMENGEAGFGSRGRASLGSDEVSFSSTV